ncbi:hypothetical protein E2C01_063575 [Portunus trituberculatus]|uniref:Uncharacterized protein n=1 Tax=Portunus trituberculatus TaxID=210409 RepID=A0A5B7HE18_PORTR|nr:hypothetical protein [Portunus trituberculatus]
MALGDASVEILLPGGVVKGGLRKDTSHSLVTEQQKCDPIWKWETPTKKAEEEEEEEEKEEEEEEEEEEVTE